ncbi:hypothetical protein DUI87_33304 [Hirundo rustica rustica]|uniref:Sushi domain-containing protein n=1 Tax=Hirundo rustica rustica TaxID=333673 RepID=A0A3M0ILL2_HIRRU|nr:hypothetical protein DUI87_33304 [Hirundo rustica rustica]
MARPLLCATAALLLLRSAADTARCSRPKAVANAHIDAGNRTELNSRLRYSCKPGYKRKAGTLQPHPVHPLERLRAPLDRPHAPVHPFHPVRGLFRRIPAAAGHRNRGRLLLEEEEEEEECRFLWISRSQLLEDEAGLEERHHIIPREPGNSSGAGNILLQPPGIWSWAEILLHLEFRAGLKSCSNISLEFGAGLKSCSSHLEFGAGLKSCSNISLEFRAGLKSCSIHLEFGAGLKSCSNIQLILELG